MAFGERHLNCYVGLKHKHIKATVRGMVFKDISICQLLHRRTEKQPAASERRRNERRRYGEIAMIEEEEEV